MSPVHYEDDIEMHCIHLKTFNQANKVLALLS